MKWVLGHCFKVAKTQRSIFQNINCNNNNNNNIFIVYLLITELIFSGPKGSIGPKGMKGQRGEKGDSGTGTDEATICKCLWLFEKQMLLYLVTTRYMWNIFTNTDVNNIQSINHFYHDESFYHSNNTNSFINLCEMSIAYYLWNN